MSVRRCPRCGAGSGGVIGGGTAGVNAARVATGIGADVTILEVDFERMRFLDITMAGAQTVYSCEANLSELLPRVDLLIGAVLVPGAYSRTATQALNNVTHAWTHLIAENGVPAACARRRELYSGINVHAGKITCKPVAESHGLEFHDIAGQLS